jgi:EAL domain-containing protein (putative c-di-GMP-specific phosphodiesterase class I)/GGDEF domain-containing protein
MTRAAVTPTCVPDLRLRLPRPDLGTIAVAMDPVTLISLLPELVLLVRRDGEIVAHAGGLALPDLRPSGDAGAPRFDPPWSEATGTLVTQLVRRSISQRTHVDSSFRELGHQYEVRATPQGPDRAVVVVRPARLEAAEEPTDVTGDRSRPELDRRGFLRRLKESVSLATLREQSLAVAVLYVEGIAEIAQVIAARVSEEALNAAILRLSAFAGVDLDGRRKWYLGQLGENALALVIDSTDREEIEACVTHVAASLREPIALGDAEFRLTVHAGVGVLGFDASTPKALLERARAAAAEARRAASNEVFFHSDTLRLRSLARLDMARELQEAVTNGDVNFRYVSRHDLRSGSVVAWVAYLRWEHPLRGEILPTEFLRVAQSTGMAVSLSRAGLDRLCADFMQLGAGSDADARISFGPLHDHVLHDDFQQDIERVIADGRLPAKRLELRISERTFVACDVAVLRALRKTGVRLVVDEVGRDLGSLASLARAPMWGLQLDRAWTVALRGDEVARSVCRAALSVATALGLAPIATGVDNQQQRDVLIEMGFRYGTGDLYAVPAHDISARSHA